MQGGVAVVFGQALVLVAFTGKLDAGVFGQRDAQRLPVQLLAAQVTHGCKAGRGRTLLKFLTAFVISESKVRYGTWKRIKPN